MTKVLHYSRVLPKRKDTEINDTSSSESSGEDYEDVCRNADLESDDSDDEPPAGQALVQSNK